jgi:hypothetical protein
LPTDTTSTQISTVPKDTKSAGETIAAIPHGGNTLSLALTADPVEVKSLVKSASGKPANDYAEYYWGGDLRKEVDQFEVGFTPSPYQLLLKVIVDAVDLIGIDINRNTCIKAHHTLSCIAKYFVNQKSGHTYLGLSSVTRKYRRCVIRAWLGVYASSLIANWTRAIRKGLS